MFIPPIFLTSFLSWKTLHDIVIQLLMLLLQVLFKRKPTVTTK